MKRLRGAIGAVMVAGLFTVFSSAAFPLCAIYTPDDVEYYLFFCYLKDEDAK